MPRGFEGSAALKLEPEPPKGRAERISAREIPPKKTPLPAPKEKVIVKPEEVEVDLLKTFEKETRGMSIERAKALIPNAAKLWDTVNAKLHTEMDPLAHLALLQEAEKYGQKPALPTAYVFALAKYAEALQEGDAETADAELLNVKHLTETLGLGEVEIRKKARRGAAPEAAEWSKPSRPAPPEYEVDLSGLEPEEEGEAPQVSGVRLKKQKASYAAPEPYVAKFSPLPAGVKEASDEYVGGLMKEERAKEILGSSYNLVGKVNELLSSHPQAFPLLNAEKQKYFPQPTPAESFMFAMAKYVDARDRDDLEAAAKEETNVRKLADAVGLSGDAQFEAAMARPVSMKKAIGDVRRRQATARAQDRRWREAA